MRDTTPMPAAHPKVRGREGRPVRVLAGLAAAGVAALLGLGALGALHPAGDSLAVFRTSLSGCGLGLALMLLALGSRRGAGLAALVPALALLSLAPHWAAGGAAPEGGLSLYQKNLLYLTRDVDRIRDDILTARPDVVTFEEVHPNNERILGELAAAYPAQVRCPARDAVGDVAVLSRYPFREGSVRCSRTPGMASAVVEAPDGPVTVAAIHFEWPWPHRQPVQAERLIGEIASLEGPAVIGGDFNMVRWSATIRRIAEASGTEPVGPARVTFPMGPGPFVGVSIDHVLAPGGAGATELRPLLGSDHLGVLARIAPPERETASDPVAQVGTGAAAASPPAGL